MILRMLSVAVAASVVGFVAAPHPRSRQESADLNQMQGEWETIAFYVGREPCKGRFVIDGNTLAYWGLDGRKGSEWKLRLDASRSPRRFDALPVDGGEPLCGIYDFDGGRLSLSWGERGERPTTFSPGPTFTSLELRRPAPPPCAIPEVVPGILEPHAASIRMPPPPMLR